MPIEGVTELFLPYLFLSLEAELAVRTWLRIDCPVTLKIKIVNIYT